MTFNPKNYGYLSASQEAILRFFGNTRRWLTPDELARSTGFACGTATKIIRQLLKLGLVVRRKRNWGFDAGTFEYYREPRLRSLAARRRDRENAYRRAGVEPLERKLIRLLGAKRTRELFSPQGKATPEQLQQEDVFRESN